MVNKLRLVRARVNHKCFSSDRKLKSDECMNIIKKGFNRYVVITCITLMQD